jgi:alpha-ribazole phosphatase
LSKLLLVRHGRTRLHQADRFWGSTDIPLSNTGIRQAEQLRDRLAKEKIHAVYTSKLSRARSTAEIIASQHNLKITACEELNECNFGYIEGLTFPEIQRLHPELAQVLNGFDTLARFPGGESFEELNSRVQHFLTKLNMHKPKETILIVAHGSPLQIMICHLLGIAVKHWRQIRLDLASLSILETYPQANILSLLNDVSHLKA